MSEYDMSRGGVWLGAARKWMQWNKRNGSTVTWSSAEELRPSVTVREAEDMARRVAEAVYEEMDGEVARLREALERIRAVHASGVGDIGKARRMDDIARAALAVGKGGT